VTIRARARSSADAPVTSWSVRRDGQAIAGLPGTLRPDGEREWSIPVQARSSEIQLFATNRHGTGSPATIRVSWSGAAPGFQIQPRLYVLAIGVAAYKHDAIPRLALPAKDARDFAAVMQDQQGRLYREVKIKLATDGQATRDEVIDGLDWLQQQVTQHDIGMVFIAGHGVNDPNLGYTFLPFDADVDKLRRTAVTMEEFRRTLAALPGKTVMFLDTCHSGNILGGKLARGVSDDINGIINELSSAENGIVVFSSSTGRQASYEDTGWGNGAFTKALVEGLGGAADYQKSGRITHKMLDLYVSERVKALTGGLQSPVTQAPGGVPDFPLAIKR
jgi:uncharacterized caspase-like protein